MTKTYTVGSTTYGITEDHLTVLRMDGQETVRYPYKLIVIGAGKSGSDGPYLSIDIIDRQTGEVVHSIPNHGVNFDEFAASLVVEHSKEHNA